jgi:hypothetical protein
MRQAPLTWKQRLYRQTPKYVTVAGYLLGFMILGAAVASYFVQSSIYSQATATAEPAAFPVSLPQAALILKEWRRPGDQVAAGDRLVDVSTDPRQLSLRIVRDAAAAGAAQLERLAVNSAPEELASLRKLASSEVPTSSPETLKSPVDGWLLVRGSAAGDNAMVVPAGVPLATVGNLSRVTVRVEASTDHAPTIRRGDRVPLLLGEFDSRDLPAALDDIQTTITVDVPRTELPDERWEGIRRAGAVRLRLLGAEGQASVALEKETVQFTATAAQFAGDGLVRVRAGKSVPVTLLGTGETIVRGKLGVFRSAFVLSLKQGDLSARVRDALTAQLARGAAAIPAGSCWIKVSTRSLFDRLFGK